MMAADTTHRAQYMMARDAAGGKFRLTSVILRLKSRRSGTGSSEIPEQLQDDFTERRGNFAHICATGHRAGGMSAAAANTLDLAIDLLVLLIDRGVAAPLRARHARS
jgi:hypothetical protein